MNYCFLFCHGWAGSSQFWEPIKAYFKKYDVHYLDLGYTGNKNWPILPEKDEAYIGIGHSLGLVKLLSLGISFKGLVGIQSCIHFLGTDHTLQQKRQYELDQMALQLGSNFTKTMLTFYKRCGIEIDPIKVLNLDQQLLLEDLQILSKAHSIPQNIPLFVLGTMGDLVIPPALIEDNFRDRTNTTIIMNPAGKHNLINYDSGLVYSQIKKFVNGLV